MASNTTIDGLSVDDGLVRPRSAAERFLDQCLRNMPGMTKDQAAMIAQKADFNRQAFALRADFVERSAIRDRKNAQNIINARRAQLEQVVAGKSPTAAQFNKGLSQASITVVEHYRAMLADESLLGLNGLQRRIGLINAPLAPDRHKEWRTGLFKTAQVVQTIDMDGALGISTPSVTEPKEDKNTIPVLTAAVSRQEWKSEYVVMRTPQPAAETALSRLFGVAQSFCNLVTGGARAVFNRSSATAAQDEPEAKVRFGPTGPSPL